MPTVFAHSHSALDPLADLRHRFVERSRMRIAALADALAGDEPDLVSMASLAHQLAGSAGTFGYAALGRAAAALEDAFRAAGGPDTRINLGRLRALVPALETAFAEIEAALTQGPADWHDRARLSRP